MIQKGTAEKTNEFSEKVRAKVDCHAASSSFLACNSRLTSRRHHPPQRAVLSQIYCFWEHEVVFQILLDGVEPRDAGTT